MNNELPYFKFFPNDWILGEITLLDYGVQGIFTNICAIYWSRGCDLSVDKLGKRIRDDGKPGLSRALSQLKNEGIIEVNEEGVIRIKFLDEQYMNLESTHRKRSAAGRKGGKAGLKPGFKPGKKPGLSKTDTDTDNKKSINTFLLSKVAKAPPDDLSIIQKTTLMFWKLFMENMKRINYKPTVLEKARMGPWSEHVRLLLNTDKRTTGELREVYDYIPTDRFWMINCRSTQQLRKHFDDILVKARGRKLPPDQFVSGATGGPHGPKDPSHKPFKFTD